MSLITFIGCGNMGKGMLTALCNNTTVKRDDILVFEPDDAKRKAVEEEFGVKGITDNKQGIKDSKYILLAVKPQVLPAVMKDIAPTLKECAAAGDEKVLVSIAAGTPIEKIESLEEGAGIPVVRIFPNLPAAIGEGLLFFCANDDKSKSYVGELKDMFKEAGITTEYPEASLEIAGFMGGCLPAYAYIFIEALSDGAVACGMQRKDAITFAAQAVKGAAGLVLQGDKHPGQLKDEVCSPGGTTIAGVRSLEECAFRDAAISAVVNAYERSQELK